VHSVQQTVLWVDEPQKKLALLDLLADPDRFAPPALVFVNSKLGAEMLAEALAAKSGLRCRAMHGDLPQVERLAVVAAIGGGEVDVVVATAVLGRGIDLNKIGMVCVSAHRLRSALKLFIR
jgi:ATP-dependent RNA helicase DDX59